MAFGEPGEPSEADRTIEITMGDNYFEPEKLQTEAGQTVRFVVKNDGEFLHEFNIGTAAMHAEHQEEMATMMEHGMLYGYRASQAEVETLFVTCDEALGPDLLVNNAGIIGKVSRVESLESEVLRRTFEVNRFAVAGSITGPKTHTSRSDEGRVQWPNSGTYRPLQKFASIHGSLFNNFSTDRHLNRRDVFKQSRSAALFEWRELAA